MSRESFLISNSPKPGISDPSPGTPVYNHGMSRGMVGLTHTSSLRQRCAKAWHLPGEQCWRDLRNRSASACMTIVDVTSCLPARCCCPNMATRLGVSLLMISALPRTEHSALFPPNGRLDISAGTLHLGKLACTFSIFPPLGSST